VSTDSFQILSTGLSALPLKLFRFQQRIEQIHEQRTRNRAADDIFQVHGFALSHAITKPHVPKRNHKEDQNHCHKENVSHRTAPPFALPQNRSMTASIKI
jgi:hypothetical protein